MTKIDVIDACGVCGSLSRGADVYELNILSIQYYVVTSVTFHPWWKKLFVIKLVKSRLGIIKCICLNNIKYINILC